MILAILCLLASACPVSADNYFSLRTTLTTPVDDNLRIPPYYVGTGCPMRATANFEGYLITGMSNSNIILQYHSKMKTPVAT